MQENCFPYTLGVRRAERAAQVGGNWNNGSNAGPCYWNCNNAPSSTNVNNRARLSYIACQISLARCIPCRLAKINRYGRGK